MIMQARKQRSAASVDFGPGRCALLPGVVDCRNTAVPQVHIHLATGDFCVAYQHDWPAPLLNDVLPEY
jgi:hypothetical protein